MATQFSVNTSYYADDGFVRITWVYSPSPNHYAYRVYRRNVAGQGTWNMIYQETGTNNLYDDYNAPAGSVEFAVVEVTMVGGVETEEQKAPVTVDLASRYYWLIHPTDHNLDISLSVISGDEFKDEYEQEVLHLIGRGRKLDQGDNWGKSGTLSGTIYDRSGKTARQARLDLEALKASQTYFYLKTPFGDVWKVVLGEISFTRIAAGPAEFVEVSIPYIEVA